MSEWFFNSIKAEDQIKGRKDRWIRDPPDVIPLTVADPDFHVAPEIKSAIIEAVESEDFRHKMTETSLEEKCALKISEVNGIPAQAGDIQLTNGVIPGLGISQRIACKPGDEVILNDPMYYPFAMMSMAHQTTPVKWILEYEDAYRFDIEKLKQVITPKTKLIYVCNPHNPTGRVMTREELRGVADIAVDHNSWSYRMSYGRT